MDASVDCPAGARVGGSASVGVGFLVGTFCLSIGFGDGRREGDC